MSRELKLSEVVLLMLAQPAYRDGRTPKELAERIGCSAMANHIPNKDMHSVYAAMSGMMTRSRKWVEPCRVGLSAKGTAFRYKGREMPYAITLAGRKQAQKLCDELGLDVKYEDTE